jgi:hydroxymethylpyrimidine kinase/phosphomethylpyrimidine kinase/thiamine-phosphate diphosphorylase
VQARSGFGSQAALLPDLSWADEHGAVDKAPAAAIDRASGASREARLPDSSFMGGERPAVDKAPAALDRVSGARPSAEADALRPALYGIVGTPEHLAAVVEAGIRTVQLRIKAEPSSSVRGLETLARSARASAVVCRAHGAKLFINDHWTLALDLLDAGFDVGLHLGQEDLLSLDAASMSSIIDSGMALGVSSHSLWELCRARSLNPAYIACGPVWPTTTKQMPWKPQALDNLAWWRAMSPCPVAAIGGITSATEAEAAASTGADLICVVRGLQGDRASLPAIVAALEEARKAGRDRWLTSTSAASTTHSSASSDRAFRPDALPHPSL